MRLPHVVGYPILILFLTLGVILGCSVGDTPMSVQEVLQGFVGSDPGATFIVRELRIPRVAVALLVGGALGISGAILQSLSRNPLASPDVLGITAGAGTAAVAIIVLGGDYGGVSGPLANIGVPAAAISGAFGTIAIIQTLTRGMSVVRFLLIGVGMHAFLGAITSWLLMTASIVDAGRALVWLTGSLNAVDWYNAIPVAAALMLAIPLLFFLHHSLEAIVLGSDVAKGLGVSLKRDRFLLIAICVVLAATATAAAGPIAFVALGAPQLAQRYLGTATPPIVGSAFLGALITMWADWLGRVLFGSVSLPVGVLTAGLGAPLLAYLIITTTKGRNT